MTTNILQKKTSHMIRKNKNGQPGPGFVQASQSLQRVLRDLAPELLEQPVVLQTIIAYITQDTHPAAVEKPRKILQKELEKILKPYVRPKDPFAQEALLDTLNGMRIVLNDQQMTAIEELDPWIQHKKDMLTDMLDDPDSEQVSGNSF